MILSRSCSVLDAVIHISSIFHVFSRFQSVVFTLSLHWNYHLFLHVFCAVPVVALHTVTSAEEIIAVSLGIKKTNDPCNDW